FLGFCSRPAYPAPTPLASASGLHPNSPLLFNKYLSYFIPVSSSESALGFTCSDPRNTQVCSDYERVPDEFVITKGVLGPKMFENPWPMLYHISEDKCSNAFVPWGVAAAQCQLSKKKYSWKKEMLRGTRQRGAHPPLVHHPPLATKQLCCGSYQET